jgi:hypothetical protein
MRRPACILAALALASPAPAMAAAAGDQASEVLLERDYYLPFDLAAEPEGNRLPQVRVPRQSRDLERMLAAARDRSRPFKVAIVGSEVDLGASPELLEEPPQRYANVLYDEISPVLSKTEASVLVATPRGVAVAGPQATAAAKSALADLPLGADPSAARLTRAAADGVRAVAEANGHPLPQSGDGENDGVPWALVAAIALALLGGAALALRWRISRASA